MSFDVHEEMAWRPLDHKSAKDEFAGGGVSMVAADGVLSGTCWRRMNSASDGIMGSADWSRGISLCVSVELMSPVSRSWLLACAGALCSQTESDRGVRFRPASGRSEHCSDSVRVRGCG